MTESDEDMRERLRRLMRARPAGTVSAVAEVFKTHVPGALHVGHRSMFVQHPPTWWQRLWHQKGRYERYELFVVLVKHWPALYDPEALRESLEYVRPVGVEVRFEVYSDVSVNGTSLE